MRHGADIYMKNVTLKTKKLRDGDSIILARFCIRAHQIRYAILPEDTDMKKIHSEAERENADRKHNARDKEALNQRAYSGRGRGTNRMMRGRGGGGRGRGGGRVQFEKTDENNRVYDS